MPYRIGGLGEVLRLRKEFVSIDDTREYRRIRVQMHQRGLLLRDIVSGTAIKTKKQQVVRAGDVLVAEIDAKVGGFGVVPSELDGAIVSSHYFTFEIVVDVADPGYVGYLMRWPELAEQVSAQGSTNYAAIRAADVLSYRVPLPPLGEQRRVADHLDHVTGMAEALGPRRQRADELRRSLIESRVDRKFSEIDARMMRVEDIGDVRGGMQKCSDRAPGMNPVRYLTVAHVGRDQISFDDPRYFEVSPAERGRRSLEAGDVLIIEGNGSAQQIGRAALFPGAEETFVHQNHVIRVRPSTQLIEPDFLNLYLNSPPGRRAVQAQARTSSGLRSLSVGRIKQILVPLPSLNEQRECVSAVRTMQSRHARLEQLTKRSSHLAGVLVPAALNEALGGLI